MDSLSIHVDRRELRHALTGPAGLQRAGQPGRRRRHPPDDRQVAPAGSRSSATSPTSTSWSSAWTRSSRSPCPSTSRARPRPCSPMGGLVDPAVDTITVRTTPAATCRAPSPTTSRTWQVGDVIRVGELDHARRRRAVDDPEMAIVTALAAAGRERSRSPRRARRAEGEEADGGRGDAALGRGRQHVRVTLAEPEPWRCAGRLPASAGRRHRPARHRPGQPGRGVRRLAPQRRRRGGRASWRGATVGG